MRVEDFGDDDELTRPGLHAVKRPAFKARRHRCYTRRFEHPAWRQDEIGTDCFVNLRRCVEARYVHRLDVIRVDQVNDELARLQYVGGSNLEVSLSMGKRTERVCKGLGDTTLEEAGVWGVTSPFEEKAGK